MNNELFHKLLNYDRGITLTYNAIDGMPFEYRKDLISVLKCIIHDMVQIYYNNYVYDMGRNNRKLYIKGFWVSHSGLLIDLGLSADDVYKSCSLYTDEIRIK